MRIDTLSKSVRGVMVWILLAGSMAFSGSVSTVSSTKQYGSWMSPEDLNQTKLVCMGYKMRVMIQVIAKDYLYLGNDIATVHARREMEKTLGVYQKKYQALRKAVKDPALSNLVVFINKTFKEMNVLLKQPYSKERAEEIIEKGEMISEAHLTISKKVQKTIKSAPVPFRSQDYYIHQIAKYYIAYQSGIRDEMSVRRMQEAVSGLQNIITEMSNDPKNTAQMNAIMGKIRKYWDVVHQFYIDIDEGGLPFVVYQTVNKIAKNFSAYSKLRMDIIRAEMEGKTLEKHQVTSQSAS